MRFTAIAVITATLLAGAFSAHAAETARYKVTKTVPMGSPEAWDYLAYDQASHRVFATHGSEITVIDGRNGDVVGHIDGLAGTNGVALIPTAGKGYTASRGKIAALVFDLKSLKVTKEIPAQEDSDGVVYDTFSNRVFIMNGDPHNITVIDAVNDTLAGLVALSGQPEFAAVDGAGKLYVNITDKREIQRVDTKTAKVDATWSIADCDGAHGLAVDVQAHRIFSSCNNEKLLVVNMDNGQVMATLPIGKGSDAVAFDAKRKLIFSSNREGTLSVLHQDTADKYSSLGEVPTQLLARTMAFDPESGRIYLVTADRIEVNPKATDPRQRYAMQRGSVRMLFVDPQP